MFILVCRYNRVFAYPGDDITLTSHLSPETSAVSMEIRWFRGIECIYLYKNQQVTVGRGYEGRLSLFPEELQRGNVSLLLREVGQADTGIYSCQVITDEHRVEKTIHLYMSGTETLSPDRWPLKIAEQDSLDMEESVHSLEMKKLLQKKEKELQDKVTELEGTSEELRRVTSLLQDRETDVDGLRKAADVREVLLKNMVNELEACKKDLETLGLQLQEKDNERTALLGELQESANAVQALTVTLQEKEQELKEEKRLQEEREKQLQTVSAMDPSIANPPQEPHVSEGVEQIEEMLREMYQNPEDQLEELERWIHKKREERRTSEEEERTEALEQVFLSSALMIKGQIEEEHEKIMTLVKTVTDLEEGLALADTDEERGELEVQLKEALERQQEGEREVERLAKVIDIQRKAIEEKYRHEMEEIKEKYEIVSRVETETNLLKIVLPDVQAYFRNMAAQFQRTFTKWPMERGKELEAADEREEDVVENSCREEAPESRMSPIEEGISDELVVEEGMDAEPVRPIDIEENDSCEETPAHEPAKSQAESRPEVDTNKQVHNSEAIDSHHETLELEGHSDMVNGVKTELREHDIEISEEHMDYTQ